MRHIMSCSVDFAGLSGRQGFLLVDVLDEVYRELASGELMPRQVSGVLERVVARPQFEELAEAAPTLAEVLRVYEEDLVVGDGELAEALVPWVDLKHEQLELPAVGEMKGRVEPGAQRLPAML